MISMVMWMQNRIGDFYKMIFIIIRVHIWLGDSVVEEQDLTLSLNLNQTLQLQEVVHNRVNFLTLEQRTHCKEQKQF